MKKVYRNWGFYRNILVLPFLKIKYLSFKGELSYQKHFFRTEIWFKLSGGGLFILNCKRFKNLKIFYIKKENWHQFKGEATFIEIQFGKKVIESDILRK